MNKNENYPILYKELCLKTEELFGFIEEQKKIQFEIIGLMKGINDCPRTYTCTSELTNAISNLACELKKSVASQKSIECNLNEVILTIRSSQKSSQCMKEIQTLCDEDNNDNRTIPLVTNVSSSPSPNRMSPMKDITELISIPEYDKCITKSSTKSLKSKICRKKPCSTPNRFSTLREDFKAISKPNIYIYVVDRFCEKLSEEIEEWSTPFYTSHVGYRMATKLGFNQDYIGIYVKLVEGDFDDLLAWPFKSEIAFTLINQVDETESLTKILKPHPCDSDEYGYWIRPKYISSCLGGWGLSDFIDMCCIRGPSNDYISEFVRNNIIYIKIKLVE